MSNIQWTDETSNPIHLVRDDGSHGGHWCRKISPGCANCYAEQQNQNSFFSYASKLPYTGQPPRNLIFDEEVLKSWRRIRQPKKIFVCSMTDLFGDWVPDAWILRVFTYIRKNPHHTFQILTKRPQRMLNILEKISWRTWRSEDDLQGYNAYLGLGDRDPLPNVWLGTSVENQQAVTDRFSPLYGLHQRGWITFYSVEPLLEEIDLFLAYYPVDWVIVGGESGNNSRACHLEWILSVVEECDYCGIPCFVKQLGSNSICEGNKFKTSDRKGGNIKDFPSDLKVRRFPEKNMPSTCSKCGSSDSWAYDMDDPDYDDDGFDFDGDTGGAFINGTWVVVSPRQNEKFQN